MKECDCLGCKPEKPFDISKVIEAIAEIEKHWLNFSIKDYMEFKELLNINKEVDCNE